MKIFCLLFFTLLDIAAFAQRQLVLFSGDNVAYRFKTGDNFRTKLIGQKIEHWGFLVEINEFSVITSQDTIELKKIRKVLLPGSHPIKSLGKKIVTAGVGLFVIDQFNNVVIQHGTANLNRGVTTASIIITSVGLPMLFFRKNWKKVSGRVKLRSVDRDSMFYMVE